MQSRTDLLSRSLSRSQVQIRIDQGAPVRASLISIGSEAARLLHNRQVGRVLAVFARSFYWQCDKGVICIGVASLGRGPLHVLLGSDRDDLPVKVAGGDSVSLSIRSIRRGGGVVPNRHGPTDPLDTVLFSGKVPGRAMEPLLSQRVTEALKIAVPPHQHGFAWIPGNTDWQYEESPSLEPNTPISALNTGLARQCLPALKCLYRWLESAREAPAEQIQTSISSVPALLGAGPGLTPSGDDLLAGVLLALHRIERTDLADALWQTLEPHVSDRTHAISGAHLRMAASGQCSEPVLSLLEHVFDDTGCRQSEDAQTTAATIQSLANGIGASSGWDTLAGMSMVLRTR